MNFSDFFFPCQIFPLPFRFHRDSSRVYAPGGDAVQEEPQQLDCTHPRKCSRYPPDRRSLARLCRCESSPSTPSRSPSIPRFWNSTQYQDSRIHYGKGRPATPHGDPHYHHGIMKESSPDVPILFCMSNTGSTAAQRNIGVGSAPNRPKRNLKHTNEGDVVVALSTHVWAHRHPPAPAAAPPSPSRKLGQSMSERTSHMQPPTRRVPGSFAGPLSFVPLSQSHPCQKFRTLISRAPLHAI